jgi:hypothetical protein
VISALSAAEKKPETIWEEKRVEMSEISFTKNELDQVDITAYRETLFFSTVDGQLCQWVEVDLRSEEGWRKVLSVEIRSRDRSARRTVAIQRGEVTVRCYAPALWPEPPDGEAELVVTCGGAEAVATVTVGTHRPWTLYLLSDCCADDSWAYSDLEQHDRDDYRTTLAELAAGEDNAYNVPSVYQIARFFRYATPAEMDALGAAFRAGRFYISPVPNQLLCGAFTLSAYPLLLEPYRHWCGKLDPDFADRQRVAYHMEAPTWTNGLINLLSCAGFHTFGKSLLRYLSPWMDALESLPVLTQLQVAPGRFVYLVLRCNTYAEGFPLLAGQPQVNQLLHGEIVPRYADLGATHPTSAIPIVGLYSDLHPDLPDLAPTKVAMVDEYNAQGWAYPRLVNGTWEDLAGHVERELGDAGNISSGLRTIRGDTGSSWEAWMMSTQAEAARFRRAQRAVVSVRALDAIVGGDDPATGDRVRDTVLELVELGDHAWNGSFQASKELNLAIRRGRLSRIEAHLATLRGHLFSPGRRGDARRVGVVNTLGWTRTCRVDVPVGTRQGDAHLADPETGETFPLRREGDAWRAFVPDVPGFGCRTLDIRGGALDAPARVPVDRWPLSPGRMKPLLIVGDEELAATGGWDRVGRGEWQIGPFQIATKGSPLMADEGLALQIAIAGAPPEEPYELRWLFDLPWEEVTWRGESGGGFVTPGPADRGGDSLLGITGSVFSCGEGLSVAAPEGTAGLDFAFDQSGLCGLGGRSTRAAVGNYGQRLDDEVVSRSVWTSVFTKGQLELYLLGNKQNPREALLDQGGAREWTVRCGLRRRSGPFDDAALYRFACGVNVPAERIDPQRWPHGASWLTIQDGPGIIPLALHRAGHTTRLDVYNTLPEAASFTLSGPAVQNRSIVRADMLDRVVDVCADGRVAVDPLAYLRVIIE